MTSNLQCNSVEHVTSYLLNQLQKSEAEQFEKHLSACSTCSKDLKDYQSIVEKLKQAPAADLSSDITLKVIQRIHNSKPNVLAPITAAAGIVLLVFTALIVFKPAQQQMPTVDISKTIEKGLDWLAQNQDSRGNWSAEKFNGDSQYDIALTSLSVMALAGHKDSYKDKYKDNVQKGIDYIIGVQSANGRFGKVFKGALYNHGIATACIMEIYSLTKDKNLVDPLKKSLDYIQKTQGSSGGWGYLNVESNQANTPVTFWMLKSLMWGKVLGFNEATESLDKGVKWLESVSDESGRPGYGSTGEFPYGSETLCAMSAFCHIYGGFSKDDKYSKLVKRMIENMNADKKVDYYKSYFLAYLDRVVNEGYFSNVSQVLAEKQKQTGSWDSIDQWSKTGGRIYSTALAALILEANSRSARLKALKS